MAQQTVVGEVHAYRLEPFNASENIRTVTIRDAGESLLHISERKRAAVGFEYYFPRTALTKRKVAVGLSLILGAQLVDVRVFDEFVLA